MNDGTGGVAAKIVIIEGKSRRGLRDGIYILIYTFPRETAAVQTMAVGPWWDSKYAYFRLAAEQDLDEMANFVIACAARPR